MRVLIADDQSSVRSALRLLLEQDSEVHIVDEVDNCSDLLAQVEEHCPDLILLDWELPGQRTTKLLPALRARCPNLFVVALSGRPEARNAALGAGVDFFVSKGDAPERLLAAVVDCRRTNTL